MNRLALSDKKNPILWRELLYQRRTTPPRLVRYETRIMVVLVVLMLFLMLFSGFAGSSGGTILLLIVMLALWLLHLVIAIRLVISGVGVISREHLNGTWEALILTGLSKRKIFFGKWRAVLNKIWKWGLALVVLWMGLVTTLYLIDSRYPNYRLFNGWTFTAICPALYIGLMLVNLRRSSMSWMSRIGFVIAILWIGIVIWPYVAEFDSIGELPRLKSGWTFFVVSPLICIAIATLEVLTCSALGIAASAVTKRGATAALLGSIIRVIPSLLTGFAIIGLLFAPFMGGNNDTLFATLFGIAEPGILIALLNQNSSADQFPMLGLFGAGVFLFVILALSLTAALVAMNKTEMQPR